MALLQYTAKATAIALGLSTSMLSMSISQGLAEDVERDRCECKLAHKGAVSTLAGGVCVRTESSSCLMEWGAGSTSRVSEGNGLSQQDASTKVLEEFQRGNDLRIEIPALVPAADAASPAQRASLNLSRIPPAAYDTRGVPESFALLVGTALYRFARGPLNFLATALLRTQRAQFIVILRNDGFFKVEQFLVAGNTGCLIIEDQSQQSQPLRVFVKTPFAISGRC